VKREERPGRILVVDDAEPNRELMAAYLEQAGHEVLMAESGTEALLTLQRGAVDLVLLDIMMPEMDGYEVCRRMRHNFATRLMPVVLVTSLDDRSDRILGMDAGADDFLTKPVDQTELLARVRSLLRVKRLTDQLDSSEAVIFALARAVEAKDAYTEQHTSRVADYARAIATAAGLSAEEQASIYRCGVVHDIGKIAVSDLILLKPGKLTPDEFEAVKRHSIIGEEICRPLRAAAHLMPAIRHHHEHWNGAGYPDGLKATAIPLSARIVAIADAFDAMTSDRPYRQAMPLDKARAILTEGRAAQWDGELVDRFLALPESQGYHPTILIARQALAAKKAAA
jgi:putative two-component system response regulator